MNESPHATSGAPSASLAVMTSTPGRPAANLMISSSVTARPPPRPFQLPTACSRADRAVDPLSEKVCVAVVARVLLDHVNHDPAERVVLAFLRSGGVQRGRGGHQLARGRAL